WRARQDPQIVAIRAADQRVLVVIIQLDHVITAVERTEERYLQRRGGWRAGVVGFTLALIPLAFHGVVSAVKHADPAVAALAVGGGHLLQTAFEAVFKTRNFVPFTQIAAGIKAPNRLYTFRWR